MATAPLTDKRQSSSRRPLRVLAVIPAGASKASMIFARRQIAGLQRAGVACETFFLASRTSPSTLIRGWRRLRSLIRCFRPDLLHAHYGTVTALFTALSSGLPLVVTYRGSDLNPDPSAAAAVWSARRLLSEIAALRASQIICVSQQLKDRLWWRKWRASVIPTGVDTDVFFPRPQSEARAQLGWGHGERIVLFNSGGQQNKRLDLAEAAAAVARNMCGEIRLKVLQGDVAPEVVPVMMSAADCLLVTSDWEGSPNVVKEAMACNLPVVTVDVGDVRLRLEGVSPARITSRNPEDIGIAVAEILMHKKRSNGRTKVAELSDAAMTARTISVYYAAVQRRGGARGFASESPRSFSTRHTPYEAFHEGRG